MKSSTFQPDTTILSWESSNYNEHPPPAKIATFGNSIYLYRAKRLKQQS